MQNGQTIIETEAQVIVQTYARPDVVFTHGEGAYLFDDQGRRYLDFAAGIAVTALGHSDPEWVAAVREQAGRLTHVSNLYHTAPQVKLAQQLTARSFADRVLYANSGSEANEAALKLARKFAHDTAGPESGKTGIVAFHNGFHGRTMGALATTYKSHYREPFAPLVPGVQFAPFNDRDAAATLVNDQTCAVIVEPVQGEGGIRPGTPAFLQGLRELCDAHHALLIFDEVQCGLGRTGRLWAHEHAGVTPDIMTLAKPLAGGLPIGALLTTDRIAQVFRPGDHGSTFAAGPLVCTAALVVLERLNRPGFLETVRENGEYLTGRLQWLENAHIIDVRGRGLLLGMELDVPVAPIIQEARQRGLLVINSGEKVLRLCPPLIISRDQIDTAVDTLSECLEDCC